jgi:thioredoxin-like negative regulator of GroEL
MIVLEILGWLSILISFYFILRPFLVFPEHYENTGDTTFYFFYTTWCGWSKKAWPHWKEFERLMKTRKVTYGGKEVKLVSVDAEEHSKMAKDFGVQGYPSFRLQSGGKTYEFEGAPTVENFRDFLKRTLGYELIE